MKNGDSIPGRSKRAIAVALIATLALLIAPICAPLCAARSCPSGAAAEPCHGMTGMSGEASHGDVVASKACRAFELPAVVIKVNESASSLHAQTAAAKELLPVSEDGVSLKENIAAGVLQRLESPHDPAESSSFSIVLRI